MRKMKFFFAALILFASSLVTGCDTHQCTVTLSYFWCDYAIEYNQHSTGQRVILYVRGEQGLSTTYTINDCDGVVSNFCVSCLFSNC